MARPLDNGAAVWAAGLIPLLVFDAELVHHGHRSLSGHAGRHPLVTAGLLAYLAAHLLGSRLPAPVRHLDPLAAAGRRLERTARV